LNHEDIRKARDHGLAARLHGPGFHGHQAQRAPHPVQVGQAVTVDRNNGWKKMNEPLCRRIIELDGPADRGRHRAAAAVPENLIPVADRLAGEIEQLRGGDTGLAREGVSMSMRDERQVPGLQDARLCP
jgi:hypothetical protein